jgi:hypothetical protein
MLEEGGLVVQFRSTVGCLHLTSSTLPVSDAMGYF